MTEDAELLRRYVETQSEAAFAELVQRRLGLVYAVALRTTHNAHRAEDVAQTVFADLARKAASLVDRPVLAGWLYRSAHFAALGVVRAEQNRAAREQEAHTMHEILGCDESDPEWEKIRPVLDNLMSELNERDRDAIMLRFFDNRPFADIGTRLQLTENSARMRVERALDKLHALLTSRGIRSTAAALSAVLTHQATAAVAPVGLAATVTGTALASAPAVAAPAVSLFQFMSTSQLSTATAGLILVLGFGTASYELHASRVAETSALLVDRENTALLANLADLRRHANAMDLAVAGLRKSIDEARAARTAARAVQDAEAEAFIARHPEIRRAAIEQQRAEAAGTYAHLFKTLGLTPPQIESFKDLVVHGTRSETEVNGHIIRYGLGGNATEARKQLRELLGEDGYRQYLEFGDSGVLHGAQVATVLAGQLFDTPTPLTAAQGAQIQAILAEGRMPVEGAAGPRLNWDLIMAKAGTVLSEPQLAILEIQRTEDEFLEASIEFGRRNRLSPQAGSSASKPGN